MKNSRIPTFRSVSLLAALVMMPVGAAAQFSHSIPIKLPKGANGMQADLALVYKPGAGNGIVGEGWQLTGLPYITRVNYGSGINYGGQDTYAHSLLGILVRQSDGSYRTKKESFTKFVATGTCGDGPCSWTVFDRSGRKEQYGTTANSVRAWGASREAWGVSSTLDLFGNYYQVAYKYDAYHLYPDVVDYTYGPGIIGLRQVKFDYESRSDTEAGYPRRTYDAMTLRLKWITVTSQSQLVRKYRLDYEYGSATGRSHLVAVQEYGSNANDSSCTILPPPSSCALPAQVFGWQHGQTSYATTFSSADMGAGSSALTWLTGDVNGDGKTDIIQPWSNGGWLGLIVYTSNGTGYTQTWSSGNMGAGVSALLTGDVNGDGKTDIIEPWNNNGSLGLVVYTSNGTGYSQTWSSPNMGQGASALTWLTGDVNGDGKTDIIQPWDNGGWLGLIVYTSNGNGYSATWGSANMGQPTYGTLAWLTGDVNGDGKTDVIQTVNAGFGHLVINVYTSDGTGYHLSSSQGLGFVSTLGWLTGDVNGDGKTDLIQPWNNNGRLGLNVYTSNGTGYDLSFSSSDMGAGVSALVTGDVNGDGKTDLIQPWNNNGSLGLIVYTSNGTGYSQTWSSPNMGQGATAITWLTGDVNGDGKTDLIQPWNNNGRLGLLAYGAGGMLPDLMTTVNNGLGGTVSVDYAPSPQVSGAVNPSSTGPGIPNTSPQPLVTKVTTSDGRGGSYATSYEYWDTRVYPGTIPNQRNLGFASATARDLQTYQYTRTYYNQSPGYEGTVASVEDRTAAGQLVKQKVHSYDVVYPPGTSGVELVRETQETLRAYELGTFAFSQWTTTLYDDYGNPTVKAQYADGLPTVTVTTTYANDTANWILGRITRITTTSGTTTLGDVQNTWTGNTITSKAEWLDTTNSWLTTTMGYDANGNVTSVTEPATGDGLIRTTTTEFDATFKAYPTKVTNALGHVTQKTYDADGLVTSLTDANGQTVTVTYDVLGRKRTESGPGTHYAEYEYRNYGDPNHQCNRVSTWVDATRVLWKEEYFDGSGFKYGITGSGDCGSAWVVVDHRKDAAGHPYQTSQPYCYGGSPVWTTEAYDAAGRVASMTTPDGKVTIYGYTTAFAAVTDANARVTKKYFNARNKTTSVVDAAGQTTTYGYDPLGRLTSVTAPDNTVTSIWYDSLNHRTRVEEPQVAPTTYVYDAVGNVTSATTRGKTVAFTYNALNRVVQKQPAGETAVSYTYDEAAYANGKGRVTTVVDASGTTHFSYAPSGQLAGYSKHIDGKDFSQQFTFDRADRLTHLTYPNGSYADYSYTDGGNVAALWLDGATTPMAAWGNYDASGKPWSVSYGNGVETTYQYDSMGHLTQLSTKKGTTDLQSLTYDWYGRPNTGGLNIGSITDNRVNQSCSDGSNTDETQTYSYDSLYRLTQADGVWGSKPYGYSSIGNPYTFGGLTTRTLNYVGQQVTSGTGLSNVTYDPSTGNMTRKVLDGIDSVFGWTTEGHLATIANNGTVVAQMTYDADGQRVKKTYTSTVKNKTVIVTTTYAGAMYEKRTYSDRTPELHTLHLFGNGQLVASVTKSGDIVTASNNPIAWRAEWALGAMYDARSVKGAAQKALHLARALAAYPSAGRWLGSVLFALVAAWLLAAFTSSLVRRGFSRRFSPALRFAGLAVLLAFGFTACSNGPGDRRVATERILNGDTTGGVPAGTYFYHRNHVNSSSVITDSLGGEATRYVYLPFGEISKQNSCGVDTVTAKFTGKEYDEETNLYYYGARYYDPAIGRFLSPDTVLPSLTDAQTLNRYSYVRNNPIVYVDPTGHFLDFIGDVVRAVENSVQYVANAIDRAANWVGNAADEAGDFIGKAAGYTWLMMKAFGSDPRSLAVFVIAVGICVATGNAPLLVVVIQVASSMLAAMVAQSIAVAAGVTNPTVLSIIGITAGLAAGGAGLTQFLKAGAAFGISYGLGRLEGSLFGDKIAARLAPLNALAAVLIVNGLAKAFGGTPAVDAPKDPNANPPTQEQLAGSGGGEPCGGVSARLTAGQTVKRVFESASAILGGTGMVVHGIMIVAAAGLSLTPVGAVVAVLFIVGGGIAIGYGTVDAFGGWDGRRRIRFRRRKKAGPPGRFATAGVS